MKRHPRTSQELTTIDKFRLQGQSCSVNQSFVYGVFISGNYHCFYASEAEAEAHCTPEFGAEFNGEWISGSYSVISPGELVRRNNEEGVYWANSRKVFLSAVAGAYEMPFVAWVDAN